MERRLRWPVEKRRRANKFVSASAAADTDFNGVILQPAEDRITTSPPGHFPTRMSQWLALAFF